MPEETMLNKDLSETRKEGELVKKSEEQILFPEFMVEGYEIKPWTLGKLRKINPHLESIFSTLKERNIQLTLDNIDRHITDLYFAAVPVVISILAISLNKDENELEDIEIPQAIRLLYAVYKQNEESIKNAFDLLRGQNQMKTV
jgi:hypothetical protein